VSVLLETHHAKTAPEIERAGALSSGVIALLPPSLRGLSLERGRWVCSQAFSSVNRIHRRKRLWPRPTSSLKVHIVNLKFAQGILFGCNNHYLDTATEDDTTVRFWRLNVANTYLKIRIQIFGYGKLKRTLRALICTMDDLRRGRKATLASGV
jgi:hypothetical protein